ncbi:MAG: TIGR01459 family HAD-type hydrolase [Xanthobacteraceae bacterium]|jgi:HAD superfamily hydrolase (TIGR01459 family)
MTAQTPTLIDGLSVLASDYDAVLCDIWGVVHNGIAATAPAGQALTRFRQGGGTVVLISNAPRPGTGVIRSLDQLGVVGSAYDGIVTSGDLTRSYVADSPRSVFHIGPERDIGIFAGLDVAFGPVDLADYVICTGLVDDDRETPETYRALLGRMRERGLSMICANPDLVVERGDRLVYCAGAIAELYERLGGEVLYTGKPHQPIYREALAKVAGLRGTAPRLDRVLAIGDSVRTDLKGAHDCGIDCLFVTGGIHAEELGGRHEPDLAVLARIFAEAGSSPKAVIRQLAW